ncbi:MAG: UvrD-helicase domain-containing protein [Comamonadaceae bacterium]|nr:UvrD-helicase domain-containing protein [Comamonadaceae bacterium]
MHPAYEHNGQPIDAAAFYAIACDPRRSVAVEACAGAGKTWMLVSRIVRALVEPASPGGAPLAPHEILAITFTKKAAGEMRQRLHEWLAQFAQATPGALAQELALRGVPPDQARALAPALQGAYAALLAAGRPVQIRTFHSWFAALLRTAPLKLLEALALPAPYELLEDDAPARAEVWRRWLRRVAADAALRADYEALIRSHGRHQTDKALQAALDKRAEFTLADAHGAVDGAVPPFGTVFPAWAGCATPHEALFSHTPTADLMQSAAQALGAPGGGATAAKAANALCQALEAGDADRVCATLLTQKGEPRKFSDKLAGIDTVRAAQDALLDLNQAALQHEGWLHQQRMARLARSLIDEFAALKRARGWVDMNDVEHAAQRMLSDPALSGWVQERLDARVRQLLVDEFQDTSPLQWQALSSWLAGYAGTGSGRDFSVFIVGDPKQSIYRFRRAEPQVFRAAKHFVREALGGSLLACDHTRRNAPAVIDAVNTALLAAQDQGEYEGYRAHTTASVTPGAVRALPPIARPEKTAEAPGNTHDNDGDNDDVAIAWRNSLTTARTLPEETLRSLECRQAADWVAAQIAAGTPPGQIMVLARKNEPLAYMQEALRARGIACDLPEKLDLADMPAVQDVVALMDALLSPAHNLSLARALKSPLFGLGDEALTQLALLARAHPGESWFDLLQKKELLAANLQALGPDLIAYQHWLLSLPPHDALQAIYDHRDALARFAAAAPAPERARTVAQLQALLSAALQLHGGRYLTAYAFVRALRKGGVRAPHIALPAAPGHDDGHATAVRLLTVHGAKGLEADTVLLLDTQAAPPRAQTMGTLIDWPGEAPAPRRFIFLARESAPPPSAADLLAAEKQAQHREELNALYVALTRARQCLALSSITPARASNAATWWQRVPADPDTGWTAPPPALPGTAEDFTLPTLPALPAHASALVATALPRPGNARPAPAALHALPALTAASEDDTAARLGQAMHWLLERASEDWPPERLRHLARQFQLNPGQVQHATRTARRILDGEGAWAWQTGEVEEAFDEIELTHQGQRLRIDRLVRRRDPATGQSAWWVLDYKSAAHPEQDPQLIAQLTRYRAAIQTLHPGQPVHAAFLSGDGRLVPVTAPG